MLLVAQYMLTYNRYLLCSNSNGYNALTLTKIMSPNPPTTPGVVCVIKKLQLGEK